MKALKVVKTILSTNTNWKFGEILLLGAGFWVSGWLVGSGKEGLRRIDTEKKLAVEKELLRHSFKREDMWKDLYEATVFENEKEVADE